MRKTTFDPQSMKLVVRGLHQGSRPSEMMTLLVEKGIALDLNMSRPGQLTLVLANANKALPSTILCLFADFLSRIHGGKYKAVYDPWTVRGRPVNLDRAVQMIGDVLRAEAAPRRARRSAA